MVIFGSENAGGKGDRKGIGCWVAVLCITFSDLCLIMCLECSTHVQYLSYYNL